MKCKKKLELSIKSPLKEPEHVTPVLVADLLLHNGGGDHHRSGQATVAHDSQSSLSPSPHFRRHAKHRLSV